MGLQEQFNHTGYMPLVYICCPFSGDIEKNIERTKEYSRFAVDRGQIPVAPTLMYPQFMSDEDERELAMFMDLVLLGKCDELWVFGETISSGMQRELDVAKRRRQTIRYFNENFEEVESCLISTHQAN